MDETVVFTRHQKLPPPMDLVWLVGPERGKRFPLLGGRATFGRSSDNHIVLPDPTISNHHGVLVYAKEGEVLFYDIASKNGISVDGKRAPIVKLKPGRQIQIGSVYLKLVQVGQGLNTKIVRRKKRVWMPLGTALFLVSLFGFSIPSKRDHQGGVPPTELSRSLRAPSPRQELKRRSAGIVRRKMTGFVEASQLAEEGRAAFEQGRFQEAHAIWKRTLAKDPFNQSAQDGFQKLEAEAGKFLEEALMTQSSSPEKSREKTQLAISISDPSSKIHARAKELLIDEN